MINSDQGRRVFALEIGGLTYRYHSGGGTSGLSSQIVSGINYEDVEAITGVSSVSSSLDISGGIGQYSAVVLTLSADRRRTTNGDPGVIFGRCGQRSGGTRAQITGSVSRSAASISINQDLSGLSYPRLLHIGAETVRVMAATSTTLNVTAGRGVANTPRQNHTIGLEGSVVPEVTTTITTFRGRRAKLYAAHQDASGNLSSWLEVVNGFIESSPTIEEQDQISLSLVPLTALLDSQVGDKGIGQAALLDGYHYFGTDSNILEYGIALNTHGALSYEIDSTSTVTAAIVSLIKNGNNTLKTDFDPSLPDGSQDSNNFGQAHPRYPLLAPFGEARKAAYPASISETTNSAGRTIYTCALNARSESYTTAELLDINHLHPVPTRARVSLTELKQHELAKSSLKLWPDIVNEVLESSGPTSIAGLGGGWGRWRLDGTSSVRVSKNTTSSQEIECFFWSSWTCLQYEIRQRGLGNWTELLNWISVNQAVLPLSSDRNRLWYAIDWSSRPEDFVQDTRPIHLENNVFRRLRVSGQRATSFPLQGVATAYYQLYEDRILVDTSLGLPTSASSDVFDIIVRFHDRELDEQRDQVFICTHESTATFDGSDVGFYLHLSPGQDLRENVSFGNWPGYENAVIFRAARITGDRPGVALLKLLESGGGLGLNGTYDVLSLGLNIDQSEIDEASFLSVDTTSSYTVDLYVGGDDGDFRHIIESVLKMMSAALVMKRNQSTGLSKLTLVSIGNDRSSEAELTINAGDWLADPPPFWGIYEDIVTQIEYEYDYSASEKKYLSSVLFNNQEAITRYGGERSKIKITLPGLHSDSVGRGAGDRYAEFLPTSSRIFNLLSNPLRVWKGEIGTGQSIYLDVGSYVKVSSPHLKGYGDEYGVTDGVGMVRSIRQELMNEGCELEIIVTGLSPVAWNATARVDSYTSDTVTVNEDDFSDSSVDDVSFFQVGDTVDYVPRGDHDNAITGLVIQGIVGNVITFTAAHGISAAQGTIEATTYANASTHHKNDAYLANSSDIINTTTPAQEFS